MPSSPRYNFAAIPQGEVLASYPSYQEAQAAVEKLAQADFPVAEVSIVGSDIKSVERVTGRLTWGRVALTGAITGAYVGLFFALVLFIFAPTATSLFVTFIAAILIGAGFGVLFSILMYSFSRNRRDFTSVMQLVASSYAVVVDPADAGRARQILDQAPPAQ